MPDLSIRSETLRTAATQMTTIASRFETTDCDLGSCGSSQVAGAADNAEGHFAMLLFDLAGQITDNGAALNSMASVFDGIDSSLSLFGAGVPGWERN